MNWKKITLYILLSFSFSWTAALIMKLADIDYSSVTALIMVGGLYMPGPAIATFVIQKFIYKESFQQYGWAFDKKSYKWLLFTPLLFIILIGLTFGTIALFGNTDLIPEFGAIDFSQDNFTNRFKDLSASKMGADKVKLPNIPIWLFLPLAIVQGIVAGATINLPFMFGEEFGSRGLMQKETQKLGFLKSNVFIGTVWGLWHLPIILMGHNYPHHPYFGIIMMCLMTIALSPAFAYVRFKTKSILGPCLLHGMINATAAIFALFIVNGNELYSSIAGWAGVIAGVIIAFGIYVFDKPFVRDYIWME